MTKKTVQNIEDLARLANVSKSTVSRALNNSPLIKPETRERIQAIAREHNFHLNAPARNLSLRQSRTIAFVTHAYQSCAPGEDLFSLEIMDGVTHALHTLGYDALLVQVDPRDASWAQQYLDSGRVDGFILMTTTRKQANIKVLADLGAPFIIWGSTSICNCSSVTGDNFNGGLLATRHLIQSGRQRVATLAGPDYEVEMQERYRGYESALQEAGQGLDPARVVHGFYTHAAGFSAMQQLLQQAPDLDAVFVNSDIMALGAINAILGSGRRVPDDVAVVGYDDLLVASLNALPLTTIRQNIPLAGKLLAQNLIQYLQTGVITHVTIPVELVIRQST